MVAENRCRAEHFPEAAPGGPRPRAGPEFSAGRPWGKIVFRVAAHDKEYWDEHRVHSAHASGEKGPARWNGLGQGPCGPRDGGAHGQKEDQEEEPGDAAQEQAHEAGPGQPPEFPRRPMPEREARAKAARASKKTKAKFLTDQQGRRRREEFYEAGEEPAREGGGPPDGRQPRPRTHRELENDAHCESGVLHKPARMDGPAHVWSTKCGWKWSSLGVAGQFSGDRYCCLRV